MDNSLKTSITMCSFPGIALAGICYGVILALIAGVAMISRWLVAAGNSLLFPPEIFAVLVGALLLCLAVACIVGGVCLGLVCCFNWSLGYLWHPITASGIAGGLTGYVCTIWPFIVEFKTLDWWSLLAFLFGPLLAMTAGAYCAMRFAIYATRDHYVRYGTEYDKSVLQTSSGQFRLKYFFVVTAWSAGMLGVAQAFGMVNAILLMFWAIFLIMQICIHRVCKILTSELSKRVLPAADKIDIVFLPSAVTDSTDFFVDADELA